MKLYHFVPKNMTGNILYPLNQLKTVHPNLYEQHVKKYDWRTEVVAGQIPILDCLWNDVLHFSPVHPSKVKNELIALGRDVPTLKAFELDAESLLKSQTVIYNYLHEQREEKYTLPGNFVPFEANELSGKDILPERTKAYYREMLEQNKNPLAFIGVPHVLYQGTLNVSNLTVVSV